VCPIYTSVVAWEAALPRVVSMKKSDSFNPVVFGFPQRRALLLTALCIGLVQLVIACGDRQESFYPSLSDADRDGAITRGWIPTYLPHSSHNIHELHYLSPSTEWCGFEFAPSDSQSFRKSLTSISAIPRSVERVPTPSVSWWPSDLTGKLDMQKAGRSGFELYIVEAPANAVDTGISLFAIDWKNGRAFFYGTREGGP
jgi:hypothetical protein